MVIYFILVNVIFEHSLAKETDCGETEEESFFPSPVSTWGKAKRKEGSLACSPLKSAILGKLQVSP